MNFEPEVETASALPDYKDPQGRDLKDKAFEGVAFTTHAFTEGKRLALRLALATENARMRDLSAEKADIELLPEAKRGAAYARLIGELREVIEDKLDPAWVRSLLISVRNLTIKGQPATVESLIQTGPPELYKEILSTIRKQAGLTERETGESVLPITSPALADGRTSNTSATTAENTASI